MDPFWSSPPPSHCRVVDDDAGGSTLVTGGFALSEPDDGAGVLAAEPLGLVAGRRLMVPVLALAVPAHR
jgi:hypothetical protein